MSFHVDAEAANQEFNAIFVASKASGHQLWGKPSLPLPLLQSLNSTAWQHIWLRIRGGWGKIESGRPRKWQPEAETQMGAEPCLNARGPVSSRQWDGRVACHTGVVRSACFSLGEMWWEHPLGAPDTTWRGPRRAMRHENRILWLARGVALCTSVSFSVFSCQSHSRWAPPCRVLQGFGPGTTRKRLHLRSTAGNTCRFVSVWCPRENLSWFVELPEDEFSHYVSSGCLFQFLYIIWKLFPLIETLR